jgi:hypothetical protein
MAEPDGILSVTVRPVAGYYTEAVFDVVVDVEDSECGRDAVYLVVQILDDIVEGLRPCRRVEGSLVFGDRSGRWSFRRYDERPDRTLVSEFTEGM